MCGTPPAIDNAVAAENGTSYPIDTDMTYTCNDGWVVSKGSTSNVDTFTSKCTMTTDGPEWQTTGACIGK